MFGTGVGLLGILGAMMGVPAPDVVDAPPIGDPRGAGGDEAEVEPAFRDGDFESAMARLDAGADGDEAVLLLELSADWCLPCNQLESEVLETPDAHALVGGDLAIRVDFESEEGQRLKRRFGVLGLPTLLVIHREGYELGRVEGYPGRWEWIEAVRDARAGRAGIDALARAARRAPRDGGLALQFAQARLVRGDTVKAMRELDTLIGAFPPPRLRRPPRDAAGRERVERTLQVAAHAARVKGRWLLRAREDGEAALRHFGAMADRFAGTAHRAHFLYWKATSLVHLGRRQEAVHVLERWRGETDGPLEALRLQAEFMVHHRYEGALEVCRALVQQAPDASAYYLLSRAFASNDELEAARAAATSAAELAPTIALYRNHLARLGAR